ncbi:MAG: ATP-binding cassette domain-containing protein, partial [Paludibacteraceae bacterium]|nr:ATP-binding cassette domain-containing protein [Paludibacteraceae bacterium]
MAALIEYNDVEICQEEQIVLRDVNVTVHSGELVYLLGKIGSGKSSWLKTLYGALPIEQG